MLAIERKRKEGCFFMLITVLTILGAILAILIIGAIIIAMVWHIRQVITLSGVNPSCFLLYVSPFLDHPIDTCEKRILCMPL